MNLLGKLFIVLIFIGSIVLAAFSVTLYATHTNWKKQAETLTVELNQKKDELKKLQDAKVSMETALKLEIKRQADRIIALAMKAGDLERDNDEARDQFAKLKEELTTAVAVTEAALAEAEAFRIQLDETSKKLYQAQSEWVSMSTDLGKRVDEAHSLAIQLTHFERTSAQLAKDYRDAIEVLRTHGLQPNPALYAKHPPAGIEGTVTEVRDRGVVQISIGSDSGLSKGHQLDIVRDREGRSSYIGKIEITSTAADVAVAQVMPEFRRGVVQRGDKVTYIEVNELVAH
jgi:hypothetical protein